MGIWGAPGIYDSGGVKYGIYGPMSSPLCKLEGPKRYKGPKMRYEQCAGDASKMGVRNTRDERYEMGQRGKRQETHATHWNYYVVCACGCAILLVCECLCV
jgi:hypothetical protein